MLLYLTFQKNEWNATQCCCVDDVVVAAVAVDEFLFFVPYRGI